MPDYAHKTLETPRLLLRPMAAGDLDALLLIFTDPLVMASFGGELLTREQMQRWLDRNLRHQEQYGYGLFSIILKDTGGLIGDCGLEQMDVEGESVAELGYDLRSDHWGRGLATEAACAVRDFAFSEIGLSRLVSLIRVGNLPSKRVAEKVGMSLLAEITRYDIRYWEYGMQRPQF